MRVFAGVFVLVLGSCACAAQASDYTAQIPVLPGVADRMRWAWIQSKSGIEKPDAELPPDLATAEASGEAEEGDGGVPIERDLGADEATGDVEE